MTEACVHVWEFVVDEARRAEFEHHYGPRGTWAVLFSRATGYLGTQLLTDEATPGRYLTIDRWQSAEAYRAFRARYDAEYAALDRQCAALTRHERALGSFVEIPPLTRGGTRGAAPER